MVGSRGGWTFAVCEVDLKVGGSYRFVWRGPTGAEMGMGGVYREIVRPERLVTATTTVRYASQAVRDAVLKTPMLTGVAESYDKMAEVLASRVGQGVK